MNLSGSKQKWLRFGLALATGLLLAAAFPKPALAGLAWLCPGLLLLLIPWESGGRTAFFIGLVGGLGWWLASLYWLLFIPVAFLPILAWLTLSAYLSLFTGAWCWLCHRCFPAPESGWKGLVALPWLALSRWLLATAVFWVATEYLRARLLTGFPWNMLGTSQFQVLPLIQISSVTGVYGVSFVLVWVSASLTVALMGLAQQPTRRWFWLRPACLPLSCLMALLIWGTFQVRERIGFGQADQLRIALVQPSVPQTLIWNAAENTNRFQKLLALTTLATAAHPALVLWPEAAIPDWLRYHEPTHQAVTGLARKQGVWMMVGADDVDVRNPGQPNESSEYYNAGFLISPEGRILERYMKRHLVIFGEYVPLAKWLPFLRRLTPVGEGGFTPGKQAVPFEFRAPVLRPGETNNATRTANIRTAMLICFEDVVPHLVREYVSQETDFLVNLTNDGWFGNSAAQWQHAVNAAFRAVENNVPLIRCTNNGLSLWVDPAGRLWEVFFGDSQDVYGPGVKIVNVPLRSGRERSLTFYTRHGDWFALSTLLATLVLTAAGWRRGQP